MMSDASDMLAAALEQMDGIIAGKIITYAMTHAGFSAFAIKHCPESSFLYTTQLNI